MVSRDLILVLFFLLLFPFLLCDRPKLPCTLMASDQGLTGGLTIPSSSSAGPETAAGSQLMAR